MSRVNGNLCLEHFCWRYALRKLCVSRGFEGTGLVGRGFNLIRFS